MRWIDNIRLYVIAQTRANEDVIRKWIDELGGTEFKMPQLTPTAADRVFREEITDADLVVGVAAKRCYNSFVPGMNPNVTKVRESWADYLDNILKQGHGSVTEHCSWTVAIEGCTRVFTAEANRHRAGVAISEASMRYIRFEEDGIDMWLPMSIRGTDPDEWDSQDRVQLERRKSLTKEIMEDTVKYIETQYGRLVDMWLSDDKLPFDEKKRITSMLRRIIPMGVCTGVVYTWNVRALRHIVTMRATPAAEEEICAVMSAVADQIFRKEPHLFGDFHRTAEGYWVPTYKKV